MWVGRQAKWMECMNEVGGTWGNVRARWVERGGNVRVRWVGRTGEVDRTYEGVGGKYYANACKWCMWPKIVSPAWANHIVQSLIHVPSTSPGRLTHLNCTFHPPRSYVPPRSTHLTRTSPHVPPTSLIHSIHFTCRPIYLACKYILSQSPGNTPPADPASARTTISICFEWMSGTYRIFK